MIQLVLLVRDHDFKTKKKAQLLMFCEHYVLMNIEKEM